MSKYITLGGLEHFLKQLKENKKFEATSTSFGGIRTGYLTNGNNYAVELDGNGKAYVNVPWVDSKVTTVDNHYQQTTKPTKTTEGLYKIKIDDAGHITAAALITKSDITGLGIAPWGTVNVTYKDLKSMVGKSQLEPGVKYCITDYVTTTKATCKGADGNDLALNSKGLGFNIVVKAITKNKLSHNAQAYARSGGLSANFSAWELKYNIEPGDCDWSGGYGVIYYMKDEWGNEAPYDFKNISIDGKYLFSTIDSNGNYVESSDKNITLNSQTYKLFTNNIIKPCMVGTSVRLNNICIVDGSSISEFGENCYNIYLTHSIHGGWNKFGINCHDIQITGCYNIFGNNCIKIGSGSTSYNNFWGEGNTFADNCKQIYSVNDTGYSASEGYSINSNTIGNNCQNILFGAGSTYNTIGNNCQNVTLGCKWKGNTIRDNANGISIKFKYNSSDSNKRNLYNVTSCVFGPNCCNIYLKNFYSSNMDFAGCFDSSIKNTKKTLQNFEFLDLGSSAADAYAEIEWAPSVGSAIFDRSYLSMIVKNSNSAIVEKQY